MVAALSRILGEPLDQLAPRSGRRGKPNPVGGVHDADEQGTPRCRGLRLQAPRLSHKQALAIHDWWHVILP
jgi:hypothetical protein